jgi:small conductance mechanosensitive channel
MLLLQIEESVKKGVTFIDKAKDYAVEYGLKIILAIIVYIIGKWLIAKLCAIVAKMLTLRHIERSLQTFLLSLVRISLLILLLLSIASMVGINITGFAALLAGAGIAIGSALNGSLGNLAGGVMILIFKPFKVGDQIEAQGAIGVVTEIAIFNTFITTPERKTVILPNGALSTGVITNYNTSGSLRVDIPMNISPSTSIEKARQVAIQAMLQHPLVLKDPAPEVVVVKIADGMVSLSLRPSALQPDYPSVFVGVQELVKNAFDAHGIEGPTPHRVVINKA